MNDSGGKAGICLISLPYLRTISNILMLDILISCVILHLRKADAAPNTQTVLQHITTQSSAQPSPTPTAAHTLGEQAVTKKLKVRVKQPAQAT